MMIGDVTAEKAKRFSRLECRDAAGDVREIFEWRKAVRGAVNRRVLKRAAQRRGSARFSFSSVFRRTRGRL